MKLIKLIIRAVNKRDWAETGCREVIVAKAEIDEIFFRVLEDLDEGTEEDKNAAIRPSSTASKLLVVAIMAMREEKRSTRKK